MLSQQPLHELYLTCQSELEAVLMARVKCRETAADLCQEAFIRLCHLDDLGGIENLKAYLFKTALNLLCDHYRSQSARQAVTIDWPADALLEPEDLRCAQTVAVGEETLDKLIAALAELPPQCQRIFYLNRFEGLRQRDIAERLNLSIRTVEDNIKRALMHIAKTLNNP
ncbi:RNA polymerase sigma factor [Methylovulum miyakonense]|uniref:RNA polymerase sigma factor n=1 Tax=Methylovulum miyakonense TaxID=645578 RepID=UPI0022B473DE|nr:RNA polymerase sigma factor [Methylovulum miyakonense]